MNTLRIEKNESIKFVPSQWIIEMMRTIALSHHPEEEQNSSKYDIVLSAFFSEKITDIFNEFSERLSRDGINQEILVDREGNISSDFLMLVMCWINVSLSRTDEFRDCFRPWILEQVWQGSIFLKDKEIHMINGQIVFSSLNKGTSKKTKKSSHIRMVTSEVVNKALV